MAAAESSLKPLAARLEEVYPGVPGVRSGKFTFLLLFR
jgi:hypothetical protein